MPKALTLLNRFDRLNRKHFRGRLKRPSMVRFSKQPAPDSATAVGHSKQKTDGQIYISIHEALRPFHSLTELILLHEMAHLWNWQHDARAVDDNCQKCGSRHHKKMLSILKREPWLC